MSFFERLFSIILGSSKSVPGGISGKPVEDAGNALTSEDLDPCQCGTTDPEDVWIGSTWYNDSSYPNTLPEKFFVKCDNCERITENAPAVSVAVLYWNSRIYRS